MAGNPAANMVHHGFLGLIGLMNQPLLGLDGYKISFYKIYTSTRIYIVDSYQINMESVLELSRYGR